MRELLSRAVSFFAKREMAGAFSRWVEFATATDALTERAAAKFRNATISARGARVRGRAQTDAATRACGGGFRNATISGAFSRWVEFAEEASEMRELLSRAVSFFAKREMAGAFSRWVEFAEERFRCAAYSSARRLGSGTPPSRARVQPLG